MAIAVDSSTPARWTGIDSGSNVTSASFTAPANSGIVVCVTADTNNSPGTITVNINDTGGLTWVPQVERAGNETTAGGMSKIFTAIPGTASARTITASYSALTAAAGTKRISCKAYVLTGIDYSGTPFDTVGANNEGGSSTNNLTTTSVTPGANGLLIVADCEWNELGVLTSSDLTIDTADYASQISVVSGYKSCTSGVGVTANLNAGGTATAQHKWCQIIVLEAASGPTEPFPAGYFPMQACNFTILRM